MEDEVMEQIRTRLAAATSAAAALAKSLEALDGSTLQSLGLWLAKQEGALRCGDCRAQMPRGKSSSVCIACGSKRPPLPNTSQFDFRVSFAFLQFLETIHPPLKAGGSNLERVRSPSKVSLVEKAVETSHEKTEDISKLDGAPLVDQSSTGSEDIAEPDDVRHVHQSSTGFEDMAKADDAPHLDQSSTGSEDMAKPDGAAHLDQSSTNFEDMTKLDDAVHLDQSSTNLESVEREPELAVGSATSTEAVSSWDTEWDYSSSHSLPAKIQPEESAQFEISSKNLEEVTVAKPQVATSTEAVSSWDTEWHYPSSHSLSAENQQEESIQSEIISKNSEEVTFDKPQVATSTEAVSSWDTEWDYPSSHSLSAENHLEESAQSEIISENSKGVTFAEPQVPEYDLSFFDSFGGMGSKDENDTAHTDAGATFWDFQDTKAVNTRLAMERFASDISAFTTITEDADSDSADSSLDVLPPPKPPVDLFGEFGASNGQNDLVGSLKSPELANVTGLQPQAHETTEVDFEEDWDDAEFVGSQSQPANDTLEPTSHVDLLPFSSGSSPALGTSFASGDVSVDKDNFLLDQSSPRLTSSNLLGGTPDNFTDFGTGLETLITTEGQKSEDPFKSVHGRSLSFGDFEKRPSDFDDLFKRSVSHGNLPGEDMAEGDELLKALQAPSIPKPAPQQGDDMFNFLNLSPAPSQVPQGDVRSTNPSHGRSSSFGTVELVPEEQGDEMFQFFHTRSHSAGSSAVEDSSGGKDILNQFSGSTPKAPPAESSEDPFSFIHASIAPSIQPEVAAVNGDISFDDDDDSFEWKSAPTPAETSSPASASSQDDLFQWASPSKPSPSPAKPSVGSGSLSGLLSLAGGLPPSQIRTTSSKEDDLFAALSRNTSGAQNRSRPQNATTQLVNGDDSEDEFSDFVSTGAMPESVPSPAPAAGHASQPPAFDVSFFDAAQPIPSEKRNLDFFGDLMGLNFTNA